MVFDDQGRAQYQCEETGGVSSALPHFEKYVYVAKVMAHVRTGSAQGANAAEWLRLVADEAISEADSLKKVWSGPFKDPRSECKYYHDRLSVTSVWEAPWAGAEFLAHVVKTLLGSDTLSVLRPRRPHSAGSAPGGGHAEGRGIRLQWPAAELADRRAAIAASTGDSAARDATSERLEPARMQSQGSRSPPPAAAACSSTNDNAKPGTGPSCVDAPGRAEAFDDGDPWTSLDKLIEVGEHPPPAQQADDGLLDLERLISSKQVKRQQPWAGAPLPPRQSEQRITTTKEVENAAEPGAVSPQGSSGAAPAPGFGRLPPPPAAAGAHGPPCRPAAAWGEARPEKPSDTKPPPPPRPPAAGARLPAAPQ